MKTLRLLSLCLWVSLMASCHSSQNSFWNQETIVGNKQVITETRDLPAAIHAITNPSSIDVVLSDAVPVGQILVRSESNIQSYVKTEVKAGVLRLYLAVNQSISTHGALEVVVNPQGIDEVELQGSGDVSITSPMEGEKLVLKTLGSGDFSSSVILKANTLVIKSLGSGDIKAMLSVDDLEVYSAGSGDMDLSGTTAVAVLKTTGSGDLDTKHLEADRAVVTSLGSGDISVYAKQHLKAISKGSGDVHYFGNPTLEKVALGSGDVAQSSL